MSDSFDSLLDKLNSKDQRELLDVARKIGDLGNRNAIQKLKDVLRVISFNDFWGKTLVNINEALIKLGDDTGIENFKKYIRDTNIHRDLRLDSARTLLKLGIYNVFDKDEKIVFESETVPPHWARELERLVNQLRKK